MDVKDRISNRRKELGLTLEDIAKSVGVSRVTVLRWENGEIENMRTDKIQSLCKALSVTPAYLMGWTDDPTKTVSDSISPVTVIPFEEIGTISAGYNGTATESPTGKIVDIPASMLNGHSKNDFFVLRVSGESMYPRLLEGDSILCLRTESVDDGDYAVVLYNGDDATVKRVYRQYDGVQLIQIDLVPVNPEYPIKHIKGADLNQCRILGKVEKLIRSL